VASSQVNHFKAPTNQFGQECPRSAALKKEIN